MLFKTANKYMKGWAYKNPGEVLFKHNSRDFNAISLSSYDLSTLYSSLSHKLIKDKLIDFIERTIQRDGSPYLACNDISAFFTFNLKYHAWSCQNICDALNIFI